MASSRRPKRALPSNTEENNLKNSRKKRKEYSIAEGASETNAQSSNEIILHKTHDDFEFKDDSLNGKCLTRCLKFLCDNLTAVEVVIYLQTNEILTLHEADLVHAKETRLEKNKLLVEFVQQRGPKAFNCFMKSLTETGQKYIFDKLIEKRKAILEEKNMRLPISSRIGSSYSNLLSIQSSLQRIYSKSFCDVAPLSLPFSFNIEEEWINLTLKWEGDSNATEDYADLLKKAFAKADMLIIEGDPGIGKSSLMHRLAFEWSQSQLSDYDLVLYIEFRKLREHEFKDIKELIVHYMRSYLDEQHCENFQHSINDKKQKILVLLDGYDESALEKQCQELSEYFYNTTFTPLRFNVLITTRRGYLSKLRSQSNQIKLRRRFTFTDIIGFSTESQKQEYISRHFNANNDTESSENTAAVTHLLNTNANIKRLSESPLMLTFICILHKKITDGTEVELYLNIIWWMIDRHQRSNPNQDVPSLFDFEHDASDKFDVIENNYQYFPQLHLLGTMAMQDIFKTSFTEADLRKFQLKEILQEVGFIRKEENRDEFYRKKIEYSFLHRTIQEFTIALTFFFYNKLPPRDFIWYVFFMAKNKAYGIIPANIQAYLHMINSSKMGLGKSRKIFYSELMKMSNLLYSNNSLQREHSCLPTIHSKDDVIDLFNVQQQNIPKSSEEAIQLLHDEAGKGDVYTQCGLGRMYLEGIIINQSDEEAVKWFTKSAEQGDADAQYNLGVMFEEGRGVPKSDVEAVKWYTKSAEQGYADAQNNLGVMFDNGRGVPQSDEESVKWYTKSAEQGNAEAQNNLGVMFEEGRGVSQSDEEAVKWYTKSAEQGDVDAQYNLGVMHLNGQGVPQSDEETVKWFTKSAEQGDADAQYNLGVMFEEGRGVPKSDVEAVKWYTKLAEQGDADAQYNLGVMFEEGRGVPQSDEEAVKWCTKSAEQGNANAQNILGWMYQNGTGVPQSYEEAVKWFTKSAEQGFAIAQSNLGWMYNNGRGVPQSYEEAFKWFKKAAEQGDAKAQCNLGLMYDEGKWVPQSDEEAVRLYRKAAEQGLAQAQNNLGWKYQTGLGVPQSDEEAVKWFTKAAEQENSYAQDNLGFMYLNGRGVPQSVEEAVKWYRKAAEQGFVDAQFNLGFMHLNGLGVPQSDEEAIKWYRKAAEQGHTNAQFNLEFLFDYGRGVPRFDGEVVKWFRKSAEQDYAVAQNNLGWMFHIGLGISQSDTDAVKWYTKAAEQGNASAQYNLGEMYQNGQGVLQSREEAKKWYRKAAEQGNTDAKSRL